MCPLFQIVIQLREARGSEHPHVLSVHSRAPGPQLLHTQIPTSHGRSTIASGSFHRQAEGALALQGSAVIGQVSDPLHLLWDERQTHSNLEVQHCIALITDKSSQLPPFLACVVTSSLCQCICEYFQAPHFSHPYLTHTHCQAGQSLPTGHCFE